MPRTLGAPWSHYVVAAVPGEPGRATALVVVEQAIGLGRGLVPVAVSLGLVLAELIPAGTSLPDVATRLVKVAAEAAARDEADGGAALLLDVSALGGVLTERLGTAGRWPVRVEITAGGHAGWSEGGVALLPRRDVALGLVLASQEERFAVSPGLALAERFRSAAAAFAFRPPASADQFDAARREADDGLVLAAGLAVWHAGRSTPGRRGPGARLAGLGDYDPHEAFRW